MRPWITDRLGETYEDFCERKFLEEHPEEHMPKPEPNPLVLVTLEFQDGARLTWKLSEPLSQSHAFMEFGKLAAKYNLGIDFEIPAPTVETPDAAGG